MVRILDDTVHWTDLNTLRLIKMSHTFGAQVGINLINFITLGNGTIGAFGFAHITVDAFVVDQQGHGGLTITD
jgi:hypothetical protein